MENPIKMDDLGAPLFQETTIYLAGKPNQQKHCLTGVVEGQCLRENHGLKAKHGFISQLQEDVYFNLHFTKHVNT